jgi:hypothetical protein
MGLDRDLLRSNTIPWCKNRRMTNQQPEQLNKLSIGLATLSFGATVTSVTSDQPSGLSNCYRSLKNVGLRIHAPCIQPRCRQTTRGQPRIIKVIREFVKKNVHYIDVPLIPLVYISGWILKIYRIMGSSRLKLNTRILKKIGVFPIVDHYYEPLFNDAHLKEKLSSERQLPGIDFRDEEQVAFLSSLNYQEEFDEFLHAEGKKKPNDAFHFGNNSFESGDAEFLFNFVRHIKPNRVIEIGCGSSTRLIDQALKINSQESGSAVRHVCIEPYEQPWLEQFGDIEVIRATVESLDLSFFGTLNRDDLLFIDSSHMIRPQGDVLREYLQIIPSLNPGVYVHVHDIFSPYDYPSSWIRDNVSFWNEQYILEATLSNNDSYQIVAALNYLKHRRYQELKNVCTHLDKEREPGSLYFKKTG